MYEKQNHIPSCTVQNQFTAYLLTAIRNYKANYLQKCFRTLNAELPLDQFNEALHFVSNSSLLSNLPPMQQIENEQLFSAIQNLRSRERYIFLARVLEERSLTEIAQSLGITYGAAAMSYHRTVSHLRNALGGTYNE